MLFRNELWVDEFGFLWFIGRTVAFLYGAEDALHRGSLARTLVWQKMKFYSESFRLVQVFSNWMAKQLWKNCCLHTSFFLDLSFEVHGNMRIVTVQNLIRYQWINWINCWEPDSLGFQMGRLAKIFVRFLPGRCPVGSLPDSFIRFGTFTALLHCQSFESWVFDDVCWWVCWFDGFWNAPHFWSSPLPVGEDTYLLSKLVSRDSQKLLYYCIRVSMFNCFTEAYLATSRLWYASSFQSASS